MRRRGRPAKRRVPAELSAPAEEHIDESVNVPIPPPVPSEPSQAGPSHPLEPAGVNIPLDQMTPILATAFRQPREPTVSIERARKLGARSYNGIGDPEKAWSWLEGNERVFNVMGCFDEQMVTYSTFLLRDKALDLSRPLPPPDPDPTRLANPNRSPGCETIYTIYCILYWDSH